MPNADARGGVVVTIEALAAEAGGEVLRRGGNAADAAIAAAFAQGVVNPTACGVAGSFGGLFYEAASDSVSVLDAAGYAPAAAFDRMWEPDGNWATQFRVVGEHNRWGYAASTVPGFVAGAGEGFARFGSGRVSWSEVVGPAIALAREGYAVYPSLYQGWMPNQFDNGFLGNGLKTLGFTEAGQEIFLTDGRAPRIGEILVQDDYGRTLERIAEFGAREFYEGETAERIAADFAAHDGTLTLADLNDYAPRFREPMASSYRGYSLRHDAAPSLGPTFAAIMGIVEGWDLEQLGWNSVTYLERLARAMHLAFRDRVRTNGDPDFVDVPYAELLDPAHLAELRALAEHPLGGIAKLPGQVPGHTTHVTAIDAAGNAAAITHSIGSASGVVTPGLGFLHNNHMIMYDPRPGQPNSIAPGKRPAHGGDPLMVFDDTGALVIAIGSPAGGRKTTAVTQAVLNVLEFGMTLQDAVSADRIHTEELPEVLVVEPRFPPDLVMSLAARGFEFELDPYGARIAGVQRHARTGELWPGADPRCNSGFVRV